MIQQRQRNRIFSIKNDEGLHLIQHEEMEQTLVGHFKDLLTEPQEDRRESIRRIYTQIPSLITKDQNLDLMRATTLGEVEEIVKGMKKNKAPRPDGFIVDFYQAGWKFLGQDILDVVEKSRRNQKVCPSLKSTPLSLIPKTTKSENPQGLRPIALCNMAGMMIKLDLSKAYDHLNWAYLKSVLAAFGFCNRQIDWVSNMISILNFSILLNRTPTSTFNASRGLRQGDLISLFLFIIAVEGLGRYIKKELRERKIKGLRIWGNNLPITHQQFVDDIMLFCAVSLKEVKRIKGILNLFMEASVTQIKKEKSCTFFFNTTGNVRTHLTRLLGFHLGNLPIKYLGTLLALNPLKMVNWHQTIEKLMNRLANWSFGNLNIAGRVVLMKAVLQAIPIYQLSAMAAPKVACAKMVEIFKNFLSGGPKQQQKWALISWKDVIKSKGEGDWD
eukprot:PITA_36396